MAAFWDMALCSLVELEQRFGDPYCLRHQCELIALMMAAVHTSATSVLFYGTIWRHMPEGCLLHSHRRDNMIPHLMYVVTQSCV
jgi:hypothetical protein